jgi:hypothetical protein
LTILSAALPLLSRAAYPSAPVKLPVKLVVELVVELEPEVMAPRYAIKAGARFISNFSGNPGATPCF